jgi:hypothetical protein
MAERDAVYRGIHIVTNVARRRIVNGGRVLLCMTSRSILLMATLSPRGRLDAVAGQSQSATKNKQAKQFEQIEIAQSRLIPLS